MQFPGVRAPSDDFASVRQRLQTLPMHVSIALDTARSVTTGVTTDVTDTSGKALLLPINANFLYADQKANSGSLVVHFQDETRSGANCPVTFYPGMIARFAFTQLLIENAAQVGSTILLMYGVDLDFQPAGLFGTVAVSGTVTTQETGYQYGAAYGSATVIAAGAVSQVFAPASNVNGAIIHQIGGYSQSAAPPALIALAKSGAAPATAIDGDIINSAVAQAAGGISMQPIPGPVRLAAGKGLWFLSTVLETAALRSVLYTLL